MFGSHGKCSVQVLQTITNVHHTIARVVLENGRLCTCVNEKRRKEKGHEQQELVSGYINSKWCIKHWTVPSVLSGLRMYMRHNHMTYPCQLFHGVSGKANSRGSNDRGIVLQVGVYILYRKLTQVLAEKRIKMWFINKQVVNMLSCNQ